jgi:acyl-CoA oxidase
MSPKAALLHADAMMPAPSAPDIAAVLATYLDGEHAALKTQVRAVLSLLHFGHRYDIDRTLHRQLIFQRCRELARHGWGATLFPGPDGRSNVPEFIAVFETLGFADINLAIKFGLQFGLFGGAIMYLGSKRHHEQYLQNVASMDLVGCYAMTEVGHGSDTRRLQTIARYDRLTDEFVIDTPSPSARKQFIGNAGMHAQMAVVFAQLEVDRSRKGVFGLLVPIRDPHGQLRPGVSIGDTGPKAGLAGIDNGWMSLEKVRVPRENLLDRFGTVNENGQYSSNVADPTDLMQRTMSGGRVAIAATTLSAAKTGLTIAVRYALRRRQFGRHEERLLLDYPMHQGRLLPKLAEAYALDALLKHAVALSGDSSAATDPSFETLAAVLKARCTWFAVDTLQTCREACGGQGYLAVNRIGILRADVDPMTTLEGDNTLLYMLTAKSLLKQFAAEVAAGGWRFIASGYLGMKLEKIAISRALRAQPDTGLRDTGFLIRLLELRKRCVIADTARQLRSAGIRGSGEDNQSPLLEIAQAHVEHAAFEQLSAQLRESPEALHSILAPVRDLFGMQCLLTHSGWHLEHETLSRRDVKRINRWVVKLCQQLRAHARLLVDGFAIPDECLGAPIARAKMIDPLEV